MDFISGALPNVMFIIGIIAIGIGLGIEFKIVEIKGDLTRNGRVAAFGIGALLIALSVFLYTRPAPVATAPSTTANITGPAQAQPTTVPAAIQASPAATPVPEATLVAPSATPVPTATLAAPSATPVPAIPQVIVPDIRGESIKDATKRLSEAGLELGEEHTSCQALAGAENAAIDAKKGRIRCQLPLPQASVARGSRVDYVLADD